MGRIFCGGSEIVVMWYQCALGGAEWVAVGVQTIAGHVTNTTTVQAAPLSKAVCALFWRQIFPSREQVYRPHMDARSHGFSRGGLGCG